MAGRKLSYRAAVSQALELTKREDWPAAATAWLNAAEAAGRYQSENREMCGREAVRAFNAAWIEPAAVTEERNFQYPTGAPLPRHTIDTITLPATSLDVFYWPMACEGEGKRGRTKGAAYMLGGTAMIGIEGVVGGIALSHVLVIQDASATQ